MENHCFSFIIQKRSLQIGHDGNSLLSVVFLLQPTCRFYFLISIGKLLGGFGSGLLTIFRFVDHMCGKY